MKIFLQQVLLQVPFATVQIYTAPSLSVCGRCLGDKLMRTLILQTVWDSSMYLFQIVISSLIRMGHDLN